AAQRLVARRARVMTGASSDAVATATTLGARHTELADVPSPRVSALLGEAVPDGATRRELARDLLRGNEIDTTGPLVLTISRIAPQKSLDVLVRASAELRCPVTWVVIGSGEPDLLADLEEQATRGGAPVHFIGGVDDPTRWLRAS